MRKICKLELSATGTRRRGESWPPLELSLPDLETLEALSRGDGEPEKRRLFDKGKGLAELNSTIERTAARRR